MRINNIEIAKDTLEVIKKGYYTLNEKTIDIIQKDSWLPHRFNEVTVLSPETLESIANDDDDFFENSFCGSNECSLHLLDADSFEVASSFPRALVMNFANAHHPGGGFLSGASAQEESLCRCSTLYASISSKKAAEMYAYNNTHHIPEDSDYMLLSKDVCVFKDRFGNYLEQPFYTSVMTIAAPNSKKSAFQIPKNELYTIIKKRLTYFFYACARYGYRDLVLGAWGCGAFGNNPYEIARCFHELLFEKGFIEFFDNVVFAILGGGTNYDAFKTVFGDKIEVYDSASDTEELKATESFCHRPICNHSINDISSNNLGYTFGVFHDGTPFEADIWEKNGEKVVSFYLPDTEAITADYLPTQKTGNIIPIEILSEKETESVLGIGMAIREPNYSYDVKPFVEYLEKMGAIHFTSNVINGGVEYYCDIEGNDIVCVHIALDTLEGTEAITPLHFREFPNLNRKFIGDFRQ